MFTAITMRINGHDKEVFLLSPIEYLDRNGNAIESMYEYPEEEHYMFCKDLNDGAVIFMADTWENAGMRDASPTIVTAVGTLELCEDDQGNIVIKKHIDQNLVSNRWRPARVKLRNGESVSREELKYDISEKVKEIMSNSLKALGDFTGKESYSQIAFDSNLETLFACKYILDVIKDEKLSYNQLAQMASMCIPTDVFIRNDFDKKISEYFAQLLNHIG